jgi:hypothetical protein
MGGARAPPPSRSALGRSHNPDPPAKKKTFQAAGLDRRTALYRQPGTGEIVRRKSERVQGVVEPPPRASGA